MIIIIIDIAIFYLMEIIFGCVHCSSLHSKLMWLLSITFNVIFIRNVDDQHFKNTCSYVCMYVIII